MYKVHYVGVTLILFYFLWSYVTMVVGTNRTQYRKNASVAEKTAIPRNPLIEIEQNKTRFHSPVQLAKSGPNKTNATGNKAQTKNNQVKNQKGVKTSKGTVQEKTSIRNKLNVTKEGVTSTKSNLRMGNRNKDEKWPKIQKRRLRDKGSSTGSTRLTKMNMMQMDEPTTFPSLPTIYKLSVQDNDNINEVLSPYTIKQQMMRIGSKFTDVNVTVDVIGRTLEYNDIVLLKLSQINRGNTRFRADDRKYVDDTNEKKIIFIVHGLSVMGMISLDCLVEEIPFVRLLSYYLEHLDKFDIFLMPMANPDGYGYKMEMWNKNLSPQDACPGVALDRNFDIGWNTTRIVSSCSQQYPGPAPFSEPETRAVRDVLHRYSHKIIAYIHVHAGTYSAEVFKGDAVLYPRGFTDIQSDDDKYIDLKGEIDETMRKASFQVYSVTVDTLYNWYGRVSGASVDYASTVYGIPYAMEFVMQLYAEESWTQAPSEEAAAHHVMVEVWKRVIDVVANNIWTSLQSNEVINYLRSTILRLGSLLACGEAGSRSDAPALELFNSADVLTFI